MTHKNLRLLKGRLNCGKFIVEVLLHVFNSFSIQIESTILECED